MAQVALYITLSALSHCLITRVAKHLSHTPSRKSLASYCFSQDEQGLSVGVMLILSERVVISLSSRIELGKNP
jgi:hypothetical protein